MVNMPTSSRNFVIMVLISTVSVIANEEHKVNPYGDDEVPWLVFIARYKNGILSRDYDWGTLIHNQVVMVANATRFKDTTNLIVFTNCVMIYVFPSKCTRVNVEKVVDSHNKKYLLLILKDQIKVQNSENIMKLANGDNYYSDECYIPYVHFKYLHINRRFSSVYIKTLYKAEITGNTVVVVRDADGCRIDQYGRSYSPLLKTAIPEEGFPLVCRGSNNKYLMVKMFSSTGDNFDAGSNYLNSPTDLLITQNVKNEIHSIIDQNGLKKNCLRNLICRSDSLEA